jgi:hypothetical protein
MKIRQSLFLSFILCISYTISAQIEVRTVNPDGTANSNCYFSTDSVQVGLTNREGLIFIDQSLKGKEFFVKELETGWENRFVLNGDTSIVLEEIQILSEVKIKPRNLKKLYKEIMGLNQSRLPEKLNLKGEIFVCEMYTISDLKSAESVDTVIDFFKCDVIILDVFGSKTFLTKNPRKYRDGYAENDKYLGRIEPICVPLDNFINSYNKLLNLERFEMKKFRKYKSSFTIEEGVRELKFYKNDTSNLMAESTSNEFLYIWDKEDSMLNRVSSYYEHMGKESSVAFNLPFHFAEFSNFNHDYTNSHMLAENEITFYSEEYDKRAVNNVFSYFYIEKKVEADVSTEDYKEVESLQNLFEATEREGTKEDFTPILYPLKFPSSIFF